MAKEIERKWLLKPSFYPGISNLFTDKKVIIKDLYFNPFTRLRKQDDKYFITIKNDGFFCRDEYEYPLDIQDFPDCTNKLMQKTRYFVQENGLFEINVYENLFYKYDDKLYKFVLIEHEQQNIEENILLPQWVGQEVTFNKKYYNYELFQYMQINSIIN